MAGKREVQIIVVADAAQAEAVLGRLGAVTEATAAKSEVSGNRWTQFLTRLKGTGPAGQTAAAGIQDVAGSLTGRLGPAAGAAENALGGAGNAFMGMGATAVGAGVAVAGAAMVAAEAAKVTVKAVAAFEQYAEAVEKVSLASGASAQDSSKLLGATELLGVSSSTTANSIGKMNAAIAAGKLEKYGIDVVRSADGNINFTKTLDNVAQSFKDNANGATRAEMARAIFGKGWVEMTPILEQGAAGLERLYAVAGQHNPILSEQDIQDAKRLRIETSALKDELSKLEIEMGKGATPAMSGLTEMVLQATTKVQDLIHNTKWLGDAMLALSTSPLIAFLVHVASGYHAAADAAAAAKAATDGWAADLQTASDAATGLVNDQMSAQQAQLSLQEMQVSWAQQAAQAAQQKAAAIKSANDQVVASEKAVSDAIHAEDKARQAIRDAQYADAQAEQNVRDVKVKATDDIRHAKEQLLQAQQQLRQDSEQDVNSARRVADAQEALRKVQEDIGSGKIKGVDATRAYTDAVTNVQRAEQDQAHAAKDQAAKIIADKVAIKDAQINLRNVEVSSREAIQKAMHDEETADRAVTDAKYAEHQAALAVTDAKNKERAATQALEAAQRTQGHTALELKQHELDLEGATIRLRTAQGKLATDTADVRNKMATVPGYAEAIRAKFHQLGVDTIPQLRAQMQGLTGDVQLNAATLAMVLSLSGLSQNDPNLTYQHRGLPVPGQSSGTTDYNNLPRGAGAAGYGHNATGGRVRAGQATIVGEAGEETFIPSVDGVIVPHDNSSRGSGVGTVNVNVNLGNGFALLDESSAEALGVKVADGVHRALLVKQGRQDLGLTGRR